MTQRRFGKGSGTSSTKQPPGLSGLRWIIILLIIQTALVGLVFLKVYNLLPSGGLDLLGDSNLAESQLEQPVEGTSPAEVEPSFSAEPRGQIRVEVLNGCGVSGVARRTSDFLLRKGYDVRDYGNASHQRYEKTTIFVRGGDRSTGEALAATISLPLEMVKMKPDPNLVDVDVTLLLGKDYNRYILPP